MHDIYISRRFRQTEITRKASDTAENLQLYRVVRFFHPRSSCTTTHISADVQRLTLNASCMTISGRRTKQLDIFCREWFSQFHSCRTFSVLSQSHSIDTSELSPHHSATTVNLLTEQNQSGLHYLHFPFSEIKLFDPVNWLMVLSLITFILLCPTLRVGGIKQWCTFCLSRTLSLSREQRGLGRLKLAQM